MSKIEWTIEPGRHIHRNGQPCVYVNIPTDPETGKRACEPVYADELTKLFVRMLNREGIEATGDYSEIEQACPRNVRLPTFGEAFGFDPDHRHKGG